MVRNTTKIILLIFLIGLILNLSGCLTAEQKLELADFATDAANYYKAKYGEEPNIESCNFYTDFSGPIPTRTKHMYARCHDNTYIFYDADRDLLVDNHQSDKISTAIEVELKRQLNAVADIISGSELIVRDYCSSAYAGAYEGNFYHTYYDGDITAFLATEDVQLTANLYLLCDENAPWAEAQKKCEEIIRTNFRTSNIVTLTVLSEECYNTKRGEYGVYAGIDDLGCYAEYTMTGSNTDSYIQKYIKIADGIYVTCAEKNFVFEDGDVSIVEAISAEDLNAKIYSRWNELSEVVPANKGASYVNPDKVHENYSLVSATSPIYQIQFSERVQKRFSDGNVATYLLFVPDEASATEGDAVLVYRDAENSYRCGTIAAANESSAGWIDLNEKDYYFIGSNHLIKPEVEETKNEP